MPIAIDPVSTPAVFDFPFAKQDASLVDSDAHASVPEAKAFVNKAKRSHERDPMNGDALIGRKDILIANDVILCDDTNDKVAGEHQSIGSNSIIAGGARITSDNGPSVEDHDPLPNRDSFHIEVNKETPAVTNGNSITSGNLLSVEEHSKPSQSVVAASNDHVIAETTAFNDGTLDLDSNDATSEEHAEVKNDAHCATEDIPTTDDQISQPGITDITNSLPTLLDPEALNTASKILHIIHRYRIKQTPQAPSRGDEGALKFLAIIYGHVRAKQPVSMCLPAFPFKSPNASVKVLGKLPDRAEELALAHLNGLCLAIGDIYSPGARLTIISDGLVYNDLLGVPDKDVWAYGESLRALSSEKGFTNIEFCRLRDLVSVTVPEDLNEMTYVTNAFNFRRALINNFSRSDWEWKVVSKIEDVCMTYRGYIKFLETDLRDTYPLIEGRTKSKYKRGIECIAREMMARGDAFANAVRQKFQNHVRLSIHPSTGASKLSVSALPVDTLYTTPWHCTVGVKLDGTIVSGMRSDFVANDTMELVYERGRPSYFREKSNLLTWGEEKGGITSEPIYPSGWLIKPAKGLGSMDIKDIDAAKVRALAENTSPIVLRDFFSKPNEEAFLSKSKDFGEPLPWKFGLLLKVKDCGADSRGLNNVLSAEWMPFHYDGLFKTVKQVRENGEEGLVSVPPRFQFFAGATSSPRDTGFTIFSTSTQFSKHLPKQYSIDRLMGKTWSVSTSSFNQTVLRGLPLIQPHPTTGKPCLRYHEPWPQSRTSFDATEVSIEDCSESESTATCEAIDSALHDRRVAYYHTWEKGDLVVSDNILTMHTRSDFRAGSDRELWRIHFD